MSRLIFHIDMDAFFASIEQARNPNLRGKPVVVGGAVDGRGVVSTCSYEARVFGVRSAMPIREARRLCPQAVFLEGEPEKYVAYSREIFRLLRDFTPAVEPFSIDEAFLDMSGMTERHGGARAAGQAIKEAIRSRFALPASIGVAPNKLLAKLVSGHAKPDGLRILAPEEVPAYLAPLPVREMWGIGEKTEAFLAGLGIRTIGDLGRMPRAELRRRMGVVGEGLAHMAAGRDDTPVVAYYDAEPPKSMGHERTLERDVTRWDDAEAHLLSLSDMVARRLRIEGYRGRTIVAKIRFASFRTITRNRSLSLPTDEDRVIFSAASALVRAAGWDEELPHAAAPIEGFEAHPARGRLPERAFGGDSRAREPIRLVGVTVANLIAARDDGLVSFLEEAARARLGTLAIDAIRDRFGEGALRRARLIGPPSRAPLHSSVRGRPSSPDDLGDARSRAASRRGAPTLPAFVAPRGGGGLP